AGKLRVRQRPAVPRPGRAACRGAGVRRLPQRGTGRGVPGGAVRAEPAAGGGGRGPGGDRRVVPAPQPDADVAAGGAALVPGAGTDAGDELADRRAAVSGRQEPLARRAATAAVFRAGSWLT